jgi:hypothetical protein
LIAGIIDAMSNAYQIAQKTCQRLASWSALLSLLLLLVVGGNQSQAEFSRLGQQDAVSLSGSPELAAVQVKPVPVQRAADDRWGNGPEAFLPVDRSGAVSVMPTTSGWSRARSAWLAAHGFRPNSPRAPPVG